MPGKRAERPNVALIGRKADVAVGRSGCYELTNVLIDMTGWDDGSHGDLDLYDEGIYPYRVEFLDGKGKQQTVYGTNPNSGCLQDVLAAAKKEFGAVPSPRTSVVVMCPASCLDEDARDGSDGARVCKMPLIDLFAEGPESRGLVLHGGGVARARLHTCLDDLVHQALVDRQDYHPALVRKHRFEYSCHDYGKGDYDLTLAWYDEHEAYKRSVQDEYSLRHSGEYYTGDDS